MKKPFGPTSHRRQSAAFVTTNRRAASCTDPFSLVAEWTLWFEVADVRAMALLESSDIAPDQCVADALAQAAMIHTSTKRV